MIRPLFVSIDGPKGTGKTTLLEAVTQALRVDGKKVIRLCEKKSDPYRGETMALVNKLARNPCRDLELRVCERFAESRAWISRHVLPKQPADSIVLIDRWYPCLLGDGWTKKMRPTSRKIGRHLGVDKVGGLSRLTRSCD